MVGSACEGETSPIESKGLVSETCYEVLGSFAKGVTECESWGKGKEAVTPECKERIASLYVAQCEGGVGGGPLNGGMSTFCRSCFEIAPGSYSRTLSEMLFSATAFTCQN